MTGKNENRKGMTRIPKAEAERFIEGNELVRFWLTGKTELTARDYAKSLLRYTRFYEMSPEELLEVGKKEAEKMLDRYAAAVGLAESTKRRDVTAVHGFYRDNYVDIAAKSGYSKVKYVRVRRYRTPDQEELRGQTRNAHIRDDAAVNLLSSCGFRIGTAVKLVWGDLCELWDCVDIFEGRAEPHPPKPWKCRHCSEEFRALCRFWADPEWRERTKKRR